MSDIVVSVCCLAYNHEHYIRQCLEGFIIQKTDFEFEVLIHDDASTDKTKNIIREYEGKYPSIIKPIYQNKNQYSQGVSVTRKFNFPRAKGKYIALCEGDDYWTDPLKLQKQVDFLERNSQYSLVFQPFLYLFNGDFTGPFSGFPATLGIMFRNIPNLLLYSPNKVLNGDTVLLFFLSFHGKFHCINELKPTVKRKDSDGVWNSLTFIKQENNRINTFERLKDSTKGTKYHYQAVKKAAAQIIASGRKIELKKMDHPLSSPMKRFLYAYKNGVLLEYSKQLLHIKVKSLVK